MNKLYITVLIAMLTACTFKVESTPNTQTQKDVAPVDSRSFGTTVGMFSGGTDDIKVRSFTVNGTDCIWAGSYKSSSLSCNWK